MAAAKGASRFGALAFCLLFALGFGAGGIFGGVLPLAETARTAWASRSWQPLPASILEVDFETGRKGTGAVHARYRYVVDGKPYESDRIGTGRGGMDNIGTWQRDWFRQLKAARDAGRPVTAWVDPARPWRAVLDRSVRWSMVAFHMPFALVFTGVGLAALWGACYLLVTPSRQLTREGGVQRRMLGDGQMRNGALWFMALFWCGLSWPMAALVWLASASLLARVVVTGFALVGLWLAGLAFTMSRRRRSSMDRTSAS